MSYISVLKQGTKNSRDSFIPGEELPVKIRVLTGQESQSCAVAAKKWMAEKYQEEYGEFLAAVFSEENDWQTLYLAVTDPDGKPIAKDVLELRSTFTDTQRLALAAEYNDLQNECAPQVDTMSAKEFEKLVADVKKKPEEVCQSIFSISSLRRVITSMANLQSNSQTDS